jgi:hypothetical protein
VAWAMEAPLKAVELIEFTGIEYPLAIKTADVRDDNRRIFFINVPFFYYNLSQLKLRLNHLFK